MAPTVGFTRRFFQVFARDLVCTPLRHPLSAFKWALPLLLCFAAFCWQSVMLHQATILYVLDHSKEVLPDVGHEVLGKMKMPMTALDFISFSAMGCFVLGTGLLRDLRLWCKVFFCCAFLFFAKGALDYMTVMTDSIGWESCEARLGKPGVAYMEGFKGVVGFAYWSRLLALEVYGADGTWPVRYCADMILSGHTFCMLLFLLGCTDLVRRLRLLNKGSRAMKWAERLLNVLVFACASADLYLIVVNHFHYTVDVVLAIIATLLLYTNAGIAVLVDSWVEWRETTVYYTDDNGAIWLPPLLVPCCCFQGFYAVTQLRSEALRARIEKNITQPIYGHAGEGEEDSGGDEGSGDEEGEESSSSCGC